MLSRTALRSGLRLQQHQLRVVAPRRAASTAGPVEDERGRQAIKRDTKRNPELYILAAVMTGAISLAGYFFASKPTSTTSEAQVSMAKDSYPWESGTSGKYQYHPGGDRTLAPRDAPSALHSVTIPNVSLPKHLHETFNKYDKEEFDDY